MASEMRGLDCSLPGRGRSDPEGRILIAHHLILYGYGHLFPSHSRGGIQDALRREKSADFRPVRDAGKRGRSPFPLVWFDEAKRRAVGAAFAEVVRRKRYTVWACAVLDNHAHLCVRTHRENAEAMRQEFVEESQGQLRLFSDVADNHPIWSNWLRVLSLCTPGAVRRAASQIAESPVKEGLAPQHWPFIQPYEGWPYPEPAKA